MDPDTHIDSPRMIANGQGAWSGSLAELIAETERYAEQRAADLIATMESDGRIERPPEDTDDDRTLSDIAHLITIDDVRFLTDDPNATATASDLDACLQRLSAVGRRDELVIAARAAGATYRELAHASGLSRAMLDRIINDRDY